MGTAPSSRIPSRSFVIERTEDQGVDVSVPSVGRACDEAEVPGVSLQGREEQERAGKDDSHLRIQGNHWYLRNREGSQDHLHEEMDDQAMEGAK